MLTSHMCTQAQLESDVFQGWARRIGMGGRLHRKAWEFAYIAQALDEREMLREGRGGLGFGVGHEPLPALFAGRGCRVLATDQATDAAAQGNWVQTGQHADSLEALRRDELCTTDEFYQRVSFRTADMRKLPQDLGLYDFCWSACCFEHLGSLDAGFGFVWDSLRFVAPGGLAVHTTEYNVWSNDDTLLDGNVLIYRRRDLEAFALRLARAGHGIELDFSDGNGEADVFVDRPPYGQHGKHLKVEIGGHVSTSFGLIIHRGV